MTKDNRARNANEWRQRAGVFRDMAPNRKADGLENAYHQAAAGFERQADAVEIERAIVAVNQRDKRM